MGTGTDVAMNSAQITLVKGGLRGIVRARQLSEATVRNMYENLGFALIYNALGVPIVAGLLYPFFGILLSPLIAAAAMTLSSVSVVGNALRLRRAGLTLHQPLFYDALVWVLTVGRPRAFRRRLLAPAHLQPGESMLDVGCGTGSLALEAKRIVGPGGDVHAIDASREMVARASRKAGRSGLQVDFRFAPAQAIPFPDGHFDIVSSTLMLHHLPRSSRVECAREMRRVVRPGGRVLAIDFDEPEGHNPLKHFVRHGNVKAREIAVLLSNAGLQVMDRGQVGFRSLQYVLATRPAETEVKK
jgi:ubiquinone/menaquinone biosynthesis C-methylase UbiE